MNTRGQAGSKRIGYVLVIAVIAAMVLYAIPALQAWACIEPDPPENGPVSEGDGNTPNEANGHPTPEPIILYNGEVTETVVDLALPGVSDKLGFKHERTYTSKYLAGTFIQGSGWKVGWFNSFLHQGSVQYYVSSSVRRDYDSDTLLGPSDYSISLAHDTNNKAYGLSTPNKTPLVDIPTWRNPDSLPQPRPKFNPILMDPVPYNSLPWGSHGTINVDHHPHGQRLNHRRPIDVRQPDVPLWGPAGTPDIRPPDMPGINRPPGFQPVVVGEDGITRHYYDFSGSYSSPQQGLLKKEEDAYGNSISYSYDSSSRRLTSVTLSNGWQVTYTYIPRGTTNQGNISQVDVKNGSGYYVKRAKYTYYGADPNFSLDLGSAGDLVMVQVLDRGTGDDYADANDAAFSICRVRMYRYYCDEDSDGVNHQIRLTFDPESVAALMRDANQTAAEILALDDTASVGSRQLKDYANVAYTYYTSNFDTSAVTADDGSVGVKNGDPNEDLEAKYAPDGDVLNETGFVRSQTVKKDYRGYLGKRTYFYLWTGYEGDATNSVRRIVVEDATTDESTHSGRRKLYALNKQRQLLREVTVDDPKKDSPVYWCQSFTRGASTSSPRNYNQIIEQRECSAHSIVDTAQELRDFLYPNGADPNESTTLSSNSGIITTYTYNNSGNVIETKTKHGNAESEKYVRAADYGTGSVENQPKELPLVTYEYPTATDTKANGVKTEFEYEFYDPGVPNNGYCKKLKILTTKLPKIPTSENGWGDDANDANAITREYYDSTGRKRWYRDAEGTIAYYSYDPNTGGLAYVMVDVDTDSLPSEITSSGNPWVAWTGTVPSGFENPYGTLQIVTKYYYDDLGRMTREVDPNGLVTCFAYRSNESRVYRGWDSTNHISQLPIQVEKVNDDGLTTEMYTVDPNGVTELYDGAGMPIGDPNGTESQEDYLTLTRYSYDPNHALLQKERRYHNIPSSGDGNLASNYYQTVHDYDSLGRRSRVIECVSGTSYSQGTEQVTKVVYDALGRVIETWRGVSDDTHSMGSGYATDPNLKKVEAIFYDESTPGSGTAGVGDGLVTSKVMYYDASDSANNVKTAYYYDWRGRLRGIEPEAPPYTVIDVDWMGRQVATAQYQGKPTWSSVLADDDYAATQSGASGARRGSLATIFYDKMSRIYRREMYEVDPATGDSGKKAVANFYHNRIGNQVARELTGGGSIEYAYDRAGRKYETRVVVDLSATKYDSSTGTFNYCAPTPKLNYADLDGGYGGLIYLAHTTYDKVGKPIESMSMETNHYGTSWGIDITNDDFVQTVEYAWYDNVHRPIAVANYGTCVSYWTICHNLTARPSSVPSRSDTVLVTSLTYADGRIKKLTDPNGIETVFNFDDLGRPIKLADANATGQERWTLAQYDGLGSIVKQIADIGKDDTFADGAWSSDDDSQVTAYEYKDSYSGKLATKVTFPDSSGSSDAVSLAYNLDGSIGTRTAQAHSGDTATVLAYDYDPNYHRLVRQRVTTLGTGVDGGIRAIGGDFDSLGRLTSVISYEDSNATTAANEVVLEYNSLGLLDKEYQEHDGAKDVNTPYVQYNYDANDANSDGVYDKAMRLVSVRYPNGRLVHYTYDSAGSISDKLSRIAAIQDDNSGAPGDVLASYKVNGLMRLAIEDFEQPDIRLDYFDDQGNTYNGFDRFGRVTKQLWRNYGASADADKVAYSYDRNSNRKYRENLLSSAKSELYAYDSLDRLVNFQRGTLDTNKTGIDGTAANEEQFTLDAVGNWTGYLTKVGGTEDANQSRGHNKANEVTSISGTPGWSAPGYDAAGNVKAFHTSETPDLLAYDAWNRLVRYQYSGEDDQADYEYDGLNRRLRKSFDGWYHDYYYNISWQLLEVRKDGAAAALEQYIWSLRYIDSPVLRDRDADGNAATGDLGAAASGMEQRVYYLTDGNFNVTALAGTDGAVLERYAYDAYGQPRVYDPNWAARQSSSYANAILFCGYFRDAETGMYHVRNRYYHPQLGRWMSRDPIGYVDGMGLYEYVGGCVTAFTDPTGLSKGWPWRGGWPGWYNYTGVGTVLHLAYDAGYNTAEGIHSWCKILAYDGSNARRASQEELEGVLGNGKQPRHAWGDVPKKELEKAIPDIGNAIGTIPGTSITGPIEIPMSKVDAGLLAAEEMAKAAAQASMEDPNGNTIKSCNQKR